MVISSRPVGAEAFSAASAGGAFHSPPTEALAPARAPRRRKDLRLTSPAGVSSAEADSCGSDFWGSSWGERVSDILVLLRFGEHSVEEKIKNRSQAYSTQQEEGTGQGAQSTPCLSWKG